MASEQPPKEPRRIGKHLPKAGSSKPETQVEKAAREGAEILRKILDLQFNQFQIMDLRSRALEKRMAIKVEIEKVVLSLKFFESLEPRIKILLWKALDSSIQTEVGLGQKLQAQGDVLQIYHNFKNLVDQLTFLEKENGFKENPPPYSPEFKVKVRKEYLKRVLGITREPENPEI